MTTPVATGPYSRVRAETPPKPCAVALIDGLTGLPNRVVLTDRLAQAFARTFRTGRPLALLFVDLDGFKGVNDTLGHAAGDDLLVVAAHRLRGAVRRSDTVARLDGDEFIVLCEDADARTALTIARRVRLAVSGPADITGVHVRVGVSVGVAVHGCDDPVITPDELLSRADAAMSAAKRRHTQEGPEILPGIVTAWA